MNQLLFPGGGERDAETNTEEMGAGKVKEFSSLEDSFSVF